MDNKYLGKEIYIWGKFVAKKIAGEKIGDEEILDEKYMDKFLMVENKEYFSMMFICG